MSISAGLLQFATSGRIRNTTTAPEYFNGGTPTVQGLLSYSITLPDVFLGGIGYRANGALSVALGGAADHYVNGLPVNAVGQVCATQSLIAPARWVGGLPIGLDGLLALAAPEVPATLTGFSNGFSNGFGA
jgi:hypothetical protein